MTFEELLQLKEELGSKVYDEAVFEVDSQSLKRKKETSDCKRLNKNRPREQTSKKQVPFLGSELRIASKKCNEPIHKDPRFNEESGTYDTKKFKENYKFVSEIRAKEINVLEKELNDTQDYDKAANMKKVIQRLKNKNLEDMNWESKQSVLRKEKADIQESRNSGKTPHFITKSIVFF